MKSIPALPLFITAIGAFQSPQINRISNNRIHNRKQWSSSPTVQKMKPSSNSEVEKSMSSEIRRFGNKKRPSKPSNYSPRTSLSAATLDSTDGGPSSSLPNFAGISIPQMIDVSALQKNGNFGAIAKVLSASLLVTGNTVGSSMFVLPETVSSVGMVWGSTIFFGVYIYNLISGLLLADVAINLHESSDCEVPSSFKDFADTALQSTTAGNAIGAASLLLNSCFLAFGIVHVGSLVASTFPGWGLDPTIAAASFSALIAGCSLTQTTEGLERISNAAVMVLFSSFASLLLPSLAQVHDPMATWLAPGTHPEGLIAGISSAIPLVISGMIFQNIVPSITKLLNFDRTKSTIAIAVGSFIPMAMYLAWCYAVLGGGLDSSIAGGSGGGAAIFTAFSASALVGSSVACVMSLAEEYESIISSVIEEKGENLGVEPCPIKDRFSIPAVALSITPPALAGLAFSGGGDFTGALSFSGTFIAPFLYGLLPIVLFQATRKDIIDDQASGFAAAWSSLPQVLLGAGTIGFLGQEFVQDLASLQV